MEEGNEHSIYKAWESCFQWAAEGNYEHEFVVNFELNFWKMISHAFLLHRQKKKKYLSASSTRYLFMYSSVPSLVVTAKASMRIYLQLVSL